MAAGGKTDAGDTAVLDRLLGKDREAADLRDAAEQVAAKFEKSAGPALADILPSVPRFETHNLMIRTVGAAMPNPGPEAVVSVLSGGESGPKCCLQFDATTLAILTSTMLGADPEQEVEPSGRPASDIEIDLIGVVANHIGKMLTEILSLKAVFAATSTTCGGGDGFAAPSQGVASLCFTVQAFSAQGSLTVLLPVGLLKSALRQPRTGESRGRDWDQRYRNAVMQVRLPVTVKIDLPATTLLAIAGWKPGDTLEFAQAGQGTAEVFVGERRLFEGELGRVGETYTIRLTAQAEATRQGRSAKSRSFV